MARHALQHRRGFIALVLLLVFLLAAAFALGAFTPRKSDSELRRTARISADVAECLQDALATSVFWEPTPLGWPYARPSREDGILYSYHTEPYAISVEPAADGHTLTLTAYDPDRNGRETVSRETDLHLRRAYGRLRGVCRGLPTWDAMEAVWIPATGYWRYPLLAIGLLIACGCVTALLAIALVRRLQRKQASFGTPAPLSRQTHPGPET